MAQKINRLPDLDERKRNIVMFATKIRNCVAAVQAAGHKGLLHSPDLVDEY